MGGGSSSSNQPHKAPNAIEPEEEVTTPATTTAAVTTQAETTTVLLTTTGYSVPSDLQFSTELVITAAFLSCLVVSAVCMVTTLKLIAMLRKRKQHSQRASAGRGQENNAVSTVTAAVNAAQPPVDAAVEVVNPIYDSTVVDWDRGLAFQQEPHEYTDVAAAAELWLDFDDVAPAVETGIRSVANTAGCVSIESESDTVLYAKVNKVTKNK